MSKQQQQWSKPEQAIQRRKMEEDANRSYVQYTRE